MCMCICMGAYVCVFLRMFVRFDSCASRGCGVSIKKAKCSFICTFAIFSQAVKS